MVSWPVSNVLITLKVREKDLIYAKQICSPQPCFLHQYWLDGADFWQSWACELHAERQTKRGERKPSSMLKAARVEQKIERGREEDRGWKGEFAYVWASVWSINSNRKGRIEGRREKRGWGYHRAAKGRNCCVGHMWEAQVGEWKGRLWR